LESVGAVREMVFDEEGSHETSRLPFEFVA
jgi:hypothetical protein